MKAIPGYLNTIWILVLALVSCSSEQLEESLADSSRQTQRFMVVDTVKVEYLGQLSLMAISPNSKDLLCLDWQREKYVFVERKSGDIKSSFSKTDDSPDNPGYNMRSPSFYGNDGCLIPGINGVFIFDLYGEFIRAFKYSDWPSSQVILTNVGSFVYPVSINDEERIIFPSVLMAKSNKLDKSHYEEHRSISVFTPSSGTFTHEIPLPPTSRYFDGLVYEQSHLMSNYTVMESVLWLNISGDPILRAYNIPNGFQLIKELNLPLLGYELPMGKQPSEADPNVVEYAADFGGITNIFPYKGDLALVYFPGFTKTQKEALNNTWVNEGMDNFVALYETFALATPWRLMIISPEGEVKTDLPIPANYRGREMLVQNDEIWVQEIEGDQEENYVVLYRLAIQSKDT